MPVRILALAVLFGPFLASLPAQEAVAKSPLRAYAEKAQGRHAYGLYLKGKKVGWETEEAKPGTYSGKDVLTVTEESHIAFSVLGKKSTTTEKAITHYDLEGDGSIVYHESRSKEDGKETIRTAVRVGRGLTLTTKTGGREAIRKIPFPKDTLASRRKFVAWLQGPPKKGDTFTTYSTAWEEENVDSEELNTFQEKRNILWGGVKTDVYAVQVTLHGAKMEAQVLPDGRPLVGTLAGGLLEVRLEKEALAKKLDGADRIDLMEATSVRVDKALGDPKKVEKLVLEVKDLGDFTVPESHRQKVRRVEGAIRLELARDHRTAKAALPAEDAKRYVRATPTCQSDHEAIRGLARKIAGDEKDPVKVAGLLQKWVYANLRKSYSDNATSALAVLDNKAGDCTEHTLLFVALARSAGVPAREVGGLAYDDATKPVFGWHAWAEIHDGSQWVSVDPTWNEVYVDATHIKLSEGTRDLAWLNVAGKLKLKVIDFKTTKKK